MKVRVSILVIVVTVAATLSFLGHPRPADAYMDNPPATLGKLCSHSTHIVVVKVDKVKKEEKGSGVIVYRKVRDIKGTWPTDLIKHKIADRVPLQDFERFNRKNGKKQAVGTELQVGTDIIRWAESGKTTVLFALKRDGSSGWCHTYVDGGWYFCHTGGVEFPDWEVWQSAYQSIALLRTFSGGCDKLETVASEIIAGKEVVVPCLAADKAEELLHHPGKVQRLRASLKLLTYDAKRDFVGWGSAEGTVVGLQEDELTVKVDGKDQTVKLEGVEILDADGNALAGRPVGDILKKDAKVEITEKVGKTVEVKLKK